MRKELVSRGYSSRKFSRKYLAASVRSVIETLETRVLLSATLTTDKMDYHPGDVAILTASDLQIGETVKFQVTSDTAGPGQEPWVVSDGITDGGEGDLDAAVNGAITTTWLVDPEGAYINAVLTATAEGDMGSSAMTMFTDSGATDFFRTVASGNWNATSTWESSPTGLAGSWTPATLTPTSAANAITIQSGNVVHVTANVVADQMTVNSGGDLEIDSGVIMSLNHSTTADILDNGTVGVGGTLTQQTGSTGSYVEVGGTGALTVKSGGLINGSGGSGATISRFTVDSGGQWTVSSGGSLSAGGATGMAVTVNAGGMATWNGAVTIGTTMILNGTVNVSASITTNSVSSLQIGGTVTMTAGTLSVSRGNGGTMGSITSGGSLILQGSSAFSLGNQGNASFSVLSGGVLSAGPNATVTGGAELVVASGATLEIGSSVGITTSGATGNIQTGTRTFNTGANYTYNGTAAQNTGNALPATVNNLTINNAAGVALSIAGTTLQVNGTLALTNGDFMTTASKTLVQPASAPASTGTGDVVGKVQRGTAASPLVNGTAYTFGNPNNTIQLSAATLAAGANIAVTLAKNAPTSPAFAAAVQRTYSITPTGVTGFTAAVQLHYNDAELNGNTASTLDLWKVVSGAWADQGATTRNTTASDSIATNNSVTLTGVSSFSDWTLASAASTAVTETLNISAADATYTAAAYSTLNITPTLTPGGASGSYSYTYYADAGGSVLVNGTGEAPTNVGTYYVKGHFASDNTSLWTNADSALDQFDITKATASITVNGYTGIYDAAAHGATVGHATGVGGADLSSFVDLGVSFTDVPGGTAHWTFDAGGNYFTDAGDADIVITPATASVVVNGYTGVYDAAAHGATLDHATGVGGADLSSFVDLGVSFTDVPGGTAHWTFDAGGNYFTDAGDADIVITPATASVVVNGYTGVYDAAAHGATVGHATGVGGADLSSFVNLGATFTDVPGGTARWTFDAGGNYFTDAGDADIVITPATASVLVNGYTGVYDAAAHGASLDHATGVGGADLSSFVDLGVSFTDVPGGTAHWTFDAGGNYFTDAGDADIVITPATASVLVNGYTGVYDAAAHGASLDHATGVGGADLSSFVDLGATFTDVPGGTAHWTFSGGTNYNDQNGNVAIDIGKADAHITVTPYSETYDATCHTAAGSAVGVLGGSLSGLNVTGTTHMNAGTYTDTWIFIDSTGNYNNATDTVIDFIAKADAIVTVSGYTGAYDAAAHGASGSVTGVDAGGAALGSTLNLGASFTDYPGGTAHWTFSGGTNYNDQSDDVAIDISKASSTTVTVGDGPFTFDGSTHTGGSGTVTGAGGLSTSATSLSYSGDQVNHGTYYVTAHYAGDTNHEASDGLAVAIDISKASSTTVTVGDGPFTFDGSTHAGGSGTVTGAGGLSTSATSLSYSGDQVNHGTYYVTAHYAGDTNHEASDGLAVAINIDKASSTTVTVGDGPFTFDGSTHTGGSGTVTGAGGLSTSATSLSYSGDQVNHGTYYVTAHYAGDTNHEASDGLAVAITINKANATLNVVGYNVAFDTNSHTATGSALGVLGENLSGLDLTGTTHTNVGTYTDTWTFSGGTNYNNASGTVTDTITGTGSGVDPKLAILLLDATGKGALTVSGNGDVVVTGGGEIVVDSSSTQAIKISGNGEVSAAEIDAKGVALSGHADIDGVIDTHDAPVADPYAALAAPAVPSITRSTSTLNISSGQVTLQPGRYVGGIKISGIAQVTLAPGIYYLQGGGFSVAGLATVRGANVMLYNAAATVNDAISFSGLGNVSLTGMTSGIYQGIALFQARNSAAAISLSGLGDVDIVGTIYAAGAAVKVTGAGNLCMTGSAALNINAHLVVSDLQVTGSGGVFVNAGDVANCHEGAIRELLENAVSQLLNVLNTLGRSFCS